MRFTLKTQPITVEARLEAMEQQVFKCQGMVERGLDANHMMITEFTDKHKIDANDIRKHVSRLYDRIDHLQAQIYDLRNENCGALATKNLKLGELQEEAEGLWAHLESAEAALHAARQGVAEAKAELASLQR
ncbi:40S ribosomal protein S5-1 [Hordeum vulgare]|nr:40S ribosomal protein S5-1 [Hordeum vulgare]